VAGGGDVAMLGLAAICWATSKLRNRACFENKNIKNPGMRFCFMHVHLCNTRQAPGRHPEDDRCWRGADHEDGTSPAGEAWWRQLGAGAEGC
jgi:hypothetical protein